MPTVSGRIPCLDGLRAFSIALVLLAHAAAAPRLTGVWETIYHGISPCAATGVNLFFVISGYLITSLLKSEHERTGRIDILSFYYRRTRRIFPTFYSYLLLIAILWAAAAIWITPEQMLRAATFTWNLSRGRLETEAPDGWFLFHFWSLAYEEQFYLVWPTLLLVLTARRAFWFPLAWLLLAPVVRLAIVLARHPDVHDLGFLDLLPSYDFLMIGSLAALWQDSARFASFPRKLHGAVPFACAFFLLVLAPYLRHCSFHHLLFGYYYVVLEPICDGLCITVVLLWLVSHPGSRAGRWLEHPVVVHVGLLSFSLYIWQQLFLTPVWHVGRMFPWNLVLVFAVAEISYHHVERPFRKARVEKKAAVPPILAADVSTRG
jgi:peptidoglycan/LPS O-acetylase OafA/YrhL